MIGRVGRGARSTLFHVVDPQTNESYTLKRVVRNSDADDPFLRQVENEYDISRRFTHPYLRKSHKLWRIRKWLKIQELRLLMEHVHGQTLQEHRPPSIYEAILLFMKIAEALEAMHHMGFVHADIKPKNILICPDNTIKIIDFGQSCPMGHKKDRVQGTPEYIAPEQVQCQRLDQRTDIFNFGASLYWVLTGNGYPTVLPRMSDVGVNLASPKIAPDPSELNSDVPTSLSNLVMDCCKTSPVQRPESMRDVINRMEVILHILDRQHGGAIPTVLDDNQSAEAKQHAQHVEYDSDFDRFFDEFLQ